jgi:ribonuclease HII
MSLIVGIDEVGRGCWAGPLVAGAVVLQNPIAGLKDSKKLSKRQRQILAAEIEVSSLAVGLGWVEAHEVDQMGLTEAVRLAMRRALGQVRQLVGQVLNEIIIDGNINFLADEPTSRAVIKADDLFPSVSAASIMAKVARDDYMEKIAIEYPNYAFDQHVGYGTPLHRQRLEEFGVSSLHRLSYKPVAAIRAKMQNN